MAVHAVADAVDQCAGQKKPPRRKSVQPKAANQYEVDAADFNFSSSQQMRGSNSNDAKGERSCSIVETSQGYYMGSCPQPHGSSQQLKQYLLSTAGAARQTLWLEYTACDLVQHFAIPNVHRGHSSDCMPR